MLRLRPLVLLLAMLLSAAAPATAEAAPRAVSAEEVYALGLKYLRNGYFTKALEQFNRVRTFYREDRQALADPGDRRHPLQEERVG